jgi:hypothetical protein
LASFPIALNQTIGEARETNSFYREEEIQTENEPTQASSRITEGHKSNGSVRFGAKTRMLNV